MVILASTSIYYLLLIMLDSSHKHKYIQTFARISTPTGAPFGVNERLMGFTQESIDNTSESPVPTRNKLITHIRSKQAYRSTLKDTFKSISISINFKIQRVHT
jgi:hypothetical protein